MAATKPSSRKAPRATRTPRTPRTPKSTQRTAAKAPVGVTKSPRVRKPTAKARQSQQHRQQSATPSPGTLSPDEIPETDLDRPDTDTDHPSHVSPRMIDLERRLSRIEAGSNDHLKGYRVTDRPPYRRRYTSQSVLFSDEEDEDEGPERVSFTHLEGTRSISTLHNHYRLVNVKYFKQILYGTFDPGNITKLGYGLGHKYTSDTSQEPRAIAHLIQCFGVYAMAVVHYAQPSVKLDLVWALEEYRFRLIDYLYVYQFDSVKLYNYTFMRARITKG